MTKTIIDVLYSVFYYVGPKSMFNGLSTVIRSNTISLYFTAHIGTNSAWIGVNSQCGKSEFAKTLAYF